jgi:DNA-binding transcriptional regulator YhcF (GntR family)
MGEAYAGTLTFFLFKAVNPGRKFLRALTVRMAAREMGMAFSTVQRAMEKLESLSVVSEGSGG